MDAIVVNIGWVYLLGLMAGLVAIAYYITRRFTALETNGLWLKEMVTELLVASENERLALFTNGPQASLSAKGYDALARSGLRSHIDANKRQLLSRLDGENLSTSYELQSRAFRLLADLFLEDPVARHLNAFAFVNGISTTLLRRVGAIYLVDIALRSN